MDPEPISFTGRLTEQETVDFSRYFSACKVRPIVRWLNGAVLMLLAFPLVGAIFLLKDTLPLILVVVFWIMVPTAWWWQNQYSVRAHYRRHPELYTENTLTITEADVALSSANVGIRLKWNQFSFLLDTPKGLMLVVQPMQPLCWLPQRLFDGNNAKNTILAYAADNNIHVRLMK